MKAPKKRLHLAADLKLQRGEHTIYIKGDRETIRVSLSSLEAIPRGPFSTFQVLRRVRMASAYLDQNWLIEVKGRPLLQKQAGRWRVQDWSRFLQLAFRFLRG